MSGERTRRSAPVTGENRETATTRATRAEALPLTTLLSQTLVAFTIEIDNQCEHRRRATGAAPGTHAWLASYPLWSMCLRHVSDEGTTAAEVLQRGFLPDAILLGRNPGPVRWGYVRIEPPGGGPVTGPAKRTWVVRLTPAGSRARELWHATPGDVEARWHDRYGERVSRLRRALEDVVVKLAIDLPDYVPMNGGYDGWVDTQRIGAPVPRRSRRAVQDMDLAALLSKVLVALTLEVEAGSPVPLVMGANVVRALDRSLARPDLSRATGVAKETLQVMVNALERQGMVEVGRDGRSVTIRLTPTGSRVRTRHAGLLASTERSWQADIGTTDVARLRRALEQLVVDSRLADSPLASAMEAPAGCWRASAASPEVLPHHPVVSHRGLYPDGS